MSISTFNFTLMEKGKNHRGNKLERILRAENVNFVQLASQISWRGKSHINRMTLYNWFQNPDLSIDKILAVAKHVPAVADAFDELDLSTHVMEREAQQLKESGTLTIDCQKQINYWRDQTISLQRRVMELQETIITLKTQA